MTRCLDSPMLEQADERRFAISQVGTRHVGFEVEHASRMQEALFTILQHFSSHETHQTCRPTSPHGEYLAGLRTSKQPFNPLPPLDARELMGLDPETPIPSVEVEKPSRSPLDLREMMNPDPTPPSSTSQKRKWSPDPLDFMQPIVPDEDQEPPDELDRTAIQYASARRLPTTMAASSTRTLGGLRMRVRNRQRSREQSRSLSNHAAGQLEREGYLLLKVSHLTGVGGH